MIETTGNERTYTEQVELDNATIRRSTAHELISPQGKRVRVPHNAVAPRLAAGYRLAN